jgi:hypothetical protein
MWFKERRGKTATPAPAPPPPALVAEPTHS